MEFWPPLAPQATAVLADGASYDDFCEFPALNRTYRGKPYRYVYILSAVRPTNMGNALSKLDLQTGQVLTWHCPGAAPGEPTFVARPGGTAEDDGVVIAPVTGPGASSFAVVLDASTWEELARAELPFATPYCFHGSWLLA